MSIARREGELTADASLAVLRTAETLVFVDEIESPQLDSDDAHHLVDVLRLRSGNAVAVADGRGHWRCCRLLIDAEIAAETTTGHRRPRRGQAGAARLEPISEILLSQVRASPITVGFALQKGERAEWTVQKLTELGVDRIVPFISEHTVVRLDQGGEAKRRGERLRKVARAAASQSRRVILPEVCDPLPLTEALRAETGPVLFAEPGATSPSKGFCSVFVGPEGGWAQAELELASGLIGLGRTVLRAETAAIVAGTLLVGSADGLIDWASAPFASTTDSATL